MPNEADTCRRFVVPRLQTAGWDSEPCQLNEQVTFSPMIAAQILSKSCNLDIKNPSAKDDLEHLPPEKLVEDILAKERRIVEIMGEVKAILAGGSTA